MIEIIGHTVDTEAGMVFIAWDRDGIAQPVFQPLMKDLLDLLMDAGYIEEYNLYNNGSSADVFFMVSDHKHHCNFSHWLYQEVNTDLCFSIIHQYFDNTHA